MAPRTRRSRITAVTTVDHTGEASNANAKDLVAQGPRRTSTSTVNNAEHRKTIAKEPESRVCASRSKIDTVRLLLIMTSTRETHLCFKRSPYCAAGNASHTRLPSDPRGWVPFKTSANIW